MNIVKVGKTVSTYDDKDIAGVAKAMHIGRIKPARLSLFVSERCFDLYKLPPFYNYVQERSSLDFVAIDIFVIDFDKEDWRLSEQFRNTDIVVQIDLGETPNDVVFTLCKYRKLNIEL